MNPIVLWGLIGGLLLLAIITVIGISSASGGNSTTSLTSVATTLDRLKTVTADAQENIQNSDLRTLNSSLDLSLTNINRDLSEPLKAKKINLKDKKNAAVRDVTDEFTELDTRLEDARLNAVFDRTYAREMAYTLKKLRSDMTALSKRSPKDVRESLQTADKNLGPLVDGFSSFNAS
jgi:predicted transcriptional regulator